MLDYKRSWLPATLLAMVLGVLALPGRASADGKVCNDYSVDIWFAYAVAEDACATTISRPRLPWRFRSWWRVQRGQCVTVFRGNAAGRSFLTYATADDGSKQWPAAGSTSNIFAESFGDGFGQDPGTCFTQAAFLCAWSPTALCANRPHDSYVPRFSDFTARFR